MGSYRQVQQKHGHKNGPQRHVQFLYMYWPLIAKRFLFEPVESIRPRT